MATMPNYTTLQTMLEQDIALKIQASMGILLVNLTELWDEGYYEADIPQPETVIEVRQKVLDAVKNLNENLNLAGETLANHLQILKDCKNKLYGLHQDIKRCIWRNDYILFCVESALVELQVTPTNISKMGTVTLCDHCMDFVQENDYLHAIRQSDIISCFPVKMTKARYLEYVAQSVRLRLPNKLHLMDKHEAWHAMETAKSDVAYLKDCFAWNAPSQYTQMGAILDEFSVEGLAGLDTEVLEALIKKYSDYGCDLLELNDVLLLLYESINSLLAFHQVSWPLVDILGGNFTLKDAYHTILENIDSTERGIFQETLHDNLSASLEKLLDAILQSNEKCNKRLTGKVDPNHSDAFFTAFQNRRVVTHLFFENINETPVQEDAQGQAIPADGQASEAYVQRLIDDLLDTIQTTLSRLEPKEQRMRRQFFMRLLRFPGDASDFHLFLEDGFADATPKQTYAIATGIVTVFDRFNFTPETDNEDDEDYDAYDDDDDLDIF